MGGSWQRRKALTDEGIYRLVPSGPSSGAYRRHLLPREKAASQRLPPWGEGCPLKGFPLGGSWQRRKALTDEGIKALPYGPSSGAYRRHLPPREKAASQRLPPKGEAGSAARR